MGDRANILVKENDDDGGVYLYSHWTGSNLPLVLRDALKKHWRWDDCPYLTRIIFDEMTREDHGETGFGISSFCGDGDDRVLVVNCEKQTVTFNNKVWGFEKYVSLSDPELETVWA